VNAAANSGVAMIAVDHRVQFDFEIEFSNGGSLEGRDFRLDIDGDDIDDRELADYLVRDLRLLMVRSVRFRNKKIIVEAHKRVVAKTPAPLLTMAESGKSDEACPPMSALSVDVAAVVDVGPGATRRDLPSNDGVRVWIVDIAPGQQWPHVDTHPHGEQYYVLSGEIIEGEQRFGAGTHVLFPPGSSHQPRSEKGVRLLGLNLEP